MPTVCQLSDIILKQHDIVRKFSYYNLNAQIHACLLSYYNGENAMQL